MKYRNKKYQEEFEEDDSDINEEENEVEDSQEEQDSAEEDEISSEDSEAIEEKSAEDKINQEDDIEEIDEDQKKQFNTYLFNVRSSIDEVNKKLMFLDTSLDTEKADMKCGISYLDAKNHMMLVYLTNLIMFSMLKTGGRDVDKSEITKKLVYLKTLLEKTKVIDLRLKSQIDKIIRISESETGVTADDGYKVNDINLAKSYGFS
jgi:U3 small nucleolar ribonucleoprotein protein LCP5